MDVDQGFMRCVNMCLNFRQDEYKAVLYYNGNTATVDINKYAKFQDIIIDMCDIFMLDEQLNGMTIYISYFDGSVNNQRLFNFRQNDTPQQAEIVNGTIISLKPFNL
jgi:hypothetical protein